MNRRLHADVDGPSHERDDLVVVDAAHRHSVDLDGMQASRLSRLDTRQHVCQPVAPSQRREPLTVKGVQRNIDAREPRGSQGLGRDS